MEKNEWKNSQWSTSLEIPAECAVCYLLKYIWEWGSMSNVGKASVCLWSKIWSSDSEAEPVYTPQKVLRYYY